MPKPAKTENLVWRRGKWYARWYVDGRERNRSLHTTDVTEAKRRLKPILEERDRLGAAVKALDNGEMAWPQAVGRFLNEVEGSIGARTLKRYEGSLVAMDDHFKNLCLHEIRHKHVSAFVSYRKTAANILAKDGRRSAKPVSNATINRDLTALSQLLEYGRDWGVVTENPAKEFNRRRMTKERSAIRHIATPEQVERIAGQFKRGLFGAGVRFAYLTGARQREVYQLRWSRVALGPVNYARLSGKGQKIRTIILSTDAANLLQSLPRPPKGDAVFWHSTGETYAEPAHKFADAAIALRALDPDFPVFTFHDLRHAYAVNYLLAGGDIYDLSRHLGHSTVKMTERYLGYLPGGSAVNREIQTVYETVYETEEDGGLVHGA